MLPSLRLLAAGGWVAIGCAAIGGAAVGCGARGLGAGGISNDDVTPSSPGTPAEPPIAPVPDLTGSGPPGGSGLALGCPNTHVPAQPHPTTVLFLIDRSPSMFGSGLDGSPTEAGALSRMQALEESLLDPESGLLWRYRSRMAFHALFYGGTESCDPGFADQVMLTPMEASRFPEGPMEPVPTLGQSLTPRPTGVALGEAIAKLVGYSHLPTGLVLVTDGDPTACEPSAAETSSATVEGSTPIDCTASIDAMIEAHSHDVRAATIGLGDEPGSGFLAAMGLASEGYDPSSLDCGAQYAEQMPLGAHRARAREELSAALSATAASFDRCVFELAFPLSVNPYAENRVAFDGVMLESEEYRLLDATHIELLGAACDASRAAPGVVPDVTEPCEPATVR